MKTIGRYRILEQIGQGGMGTVYRAEDSVLQRQVALKTLDRRLATDDESRERFLREGRLAGSFSHSNIVTIFDLGEAAGLVYIAMEFLEGEDLTKKLKGRRMSLEEKVRIALEVGKGLAYAHSEDVTHRDIKPSNVFICDTGQVKILDFGLAHIAASNLTRTGQVLGTPSYMSPEQVMGEHLDTRSDIFSFGALFYELLSHRKAFDFNRIEDLLLAIVNRDPEPIENIDPSVPHELWRIVRRCLAKDPARRYQQLDELLRELVSFRSSLESRKQRLRGELSQAVDKLRGFVTENKELLSREAEVAIESRLAALVSSSRRTDSSYMTLRGLRDGAALEYRRLRTQMEKATQQPERRASDPSPIDESEDKTLIRQPEAAKAIKAVQADELYSMAAAQFSQGNLAGCLTLLGRVLRLVPSHTAADTLSERLRLEIISLVDREEERNRSELLSAALQVLDVGFPEQRKTVQKPEKGSEVPGFSDFILSSLDLEIASKKDSSRRPKVSPPRPSRPRKRSN